jgi:predicted nucleotidyltransferase
MSSLKEYKFLTQLKSLPFIEEIYLFGSRANNTAQERSDIDIAINCPNASNADWLKIIDTIDNADTLLEIDCVRFDELEKTSLLRKQILENNQIVYKK